MNQVLVLAGGQGTRLKGVSGDIPKALVRIGGKPVLEHQLELAVKHGFRDFVFFTGYQGEKIEAVFSDGSRWNARIRYRREKEPLGTAGCVLDGYDSLAERFLVLYADTLFNIDLRHFWEKHESHGAAATLFLHPNDHPFDSDLIRLNRDQAIEGFFPAPHRVREGDFLPNIVNAALYAINKTALARLVHEWKKQPRKMDFVKDVFPSLLKNGQSLAGYVSREYIKDMGTPERLNEVEEDFRSGKIARGSRNFCRPAIFLDRDGTLTSERQAVHEEELQLFKGAGSAVRRINRSEYLSVLVTNQPFVARGDLTEERLKNIHNKLETLLGMERSYLDAIYYCPHHPDKGFPTERKDLKIHCDCRKPAIGMVERARRELAMN